MDLNEIYINMNEIMRFSHELLRIYMNQHVFMYTYIN
jgi:hypothetical protein